MNSFINLMRYGGISKESFETIQHELNRSNHYVWQMISVLTSVYYLLLFFTTFSITEVSSNMIINFVMLMFSVLSFFLLQFRIRPDSKLLLPWLYLMNAALLFFGLYIGTLSWDADQYLAVTYHVLIMSLPIMLKDCPYKMCLMNLLFTVIYCICCLHNKTGGVLRLDLYNGVCFGVLSMIFGTFMKVRTIGAYETSSLLTKASFTDGLTGLHNRRAYEEDLQVMQESGFGEDTAFISFDVNGLKVVNDSLGHAAGDELIMGAVSCMKAVFGAHGKLYRIGGDEFAAIIHANAQQLETLKTAFDTAVSSWSGSIVKQMAVSAGCASPRDLPEATVWELTKLSDTIMYETKESYYRSKGIDRLGQKKAFQTICSSFTKILKINLQSDSYQIILADETELVEEKGFDTTISGWFRRFGLSGQVHEEDLEEYLSHLNTEYLSEYFRNDKNLCSCYYRRKIGNRYYKVVMDLMKAEEYKDDDQWLYLYVKNIDTI